MAISPRLGALQRLRPLHPSFERILRDSYSRSPTVRSLVDELEHSNLIVHIVTRGAGSGPAGALHFVTTSPGARFLRITLDERQPPAALAALLGHELQHAVEVARAPWVIDRVSFAALYQQIGEAMRDHRGFAEYDTSAARRTGAAVLAELGRSVRQRDAVGATDVDPVRH